MLNILATFDDSGWKYNFVIFMIVIFVLCGIYVTIKIIRQNKKNQAPIKTNDQNDKYAQAVLDNEDIIIQKKNK